MSDLQVQRAHNLGIERSRAITDEWIQSAETDYRMVCQLTRSDDKDIVTFKRSGVQGVFTATADSFELTAKLGFLFRSFLPKIEAQINCNLDELLES